MSCSPSWLAPWAFYSCAMIKRRSISKEYAESPVSRIGFGSVCGYLTRSMLPPILQVYNSLISTVFRCLWHILIVMFLPFRLTWSLALRSTQKLGIFVLFGSGWICIVSLTELHKDIWVETEIQIMLQLFATLRSVQVGVKNGKVSTPEATWTQMWTIIETSMG